MADAFLTPEERAVLQSFVARSMPDTAYLRRANIVLLTDDGLTQEQIAAELMVPITQVRQMQRAYKRQQMALFPADILAEKPFSADDPIAEAGRRIMADLTILIGQHLTDIEKETTVTSVHETRKAIRQLRTAFRLFRPYFEAGTLTTYRRRFKQFMRRLARSRDLAVFIYKLDGYLIETEATGQLTTTDLKALHELRDYWQVEKERTDTGIRDYLAKGSFQTLLTEFEDFCQSEGHDVSAPAGLQLPNKVCHLAPVMIYEKLARVRAYDDALDEVDLKKLHALRIQLKELRYTLEFFQPVLGVPVNQNIEIAKELLTHLGDLNDVRVHLQMLDDDQLDGLSHGRALYRQQKERERDKLLSQFPTLWFKFDSPQWRSQLATAVSIL